MNARAQSTNRPATQKPSSPTQFERSKWSTGGRWQNIGPYLLVSRETGAGGSQIARHVAQRLGWEVLDKEILDILESDYGTPAIVLDVVDEKKPGWLTDLFNGWIEGHGFSQLTYVHRLHHLFNRQHNAAMSSLWVAAQNSSYRGGQDSRSVSLHHWSFESNK
jgi:hypothetical protein